MMNLEERKKVFEMVVKPHIPEKLYNYLLDNNFLTQTAAMKHHSCYEGGLFDHSFTMMKDLLKLTENMGLHWENPRSPYLIGIAHDICKLDAYIKNLDGTYSWNKNQSYRDEQHGMKSVRILRDLLKDTPDALTVEEESCIAWHMGAFVDKEYWNYYTTGIHNHQNVLWTHTADMMATHIQNI